VLRVAQGIGLGGEWGGAVLMAFEYAPANKRGFYASIPQIGLALGLCLSSGVVAGLSLTLTDAQFLAWGWRLAFFLSFALVLIGMYIRLNVMETPEFARVQKTGGEARMPIVEVISKYPGNTIAGMGARFIDGVFFNVFGVFSISYLTGTLHMPRTDALLGVMVAAFVMIFTIPFFGRLSDRVGRARIYFWGSLATGLSAFAGFWLMKHSGGNTMFAWLAVVIPLGVVYASIYGPEAALFAELFEANVRYSGISFVYQFSGIFASGISPIIATWLLQRNGGDPWMIAGYCLAAGIVSALSAAWVGLRQRREMAFSTV
jgi:MFS transporter, MHS family, shikimate and dehydroshikimate transport protein